MGSIPSQFFCITLFFSLLPVFFPSFALFLSSSSVFLPFPLPFFLFSFSYSFPIPFLFLVSFFFPFLLLNIIAAKITSFTVFLFGIYAITSRWVWSSYPWVIKMAAAKWGRFVIDSGRHETLYFGLLGYVHSNMGKVCLHHDFPL